MQTTPEIKTFGPFARALHWSIAILVIGLFALGLWMRSLNYYHPWYEAAPNLHTSFGLVFLALLICRILWRAFYPPPPPLGTNRIEHAIAALAHTFLYVLMIALAITGYLYATGEGKPAALFSLVNIPAVMESKPVADQAGVLHEWFAYAIIALTALHVAGALKHHYIDKDDTLRRMINDTHPH